MSGVKTSQAHRAGKRTGGPIFPVLFLPVATCGYGTLSQAKWTVIAAILMRQRIKSKD